MTCQCQRHARCADCMERDAVSRRPDSPAFYEERIRLLEAENKKLRTALETIAGDGTRFAPCLPDCIEGSPTCGCAERRAQEALEATS